MEPLFLNMTAHPNQIASRNKDEWYTPDKTLKVAKSLLGVNSFKYDLASCAVAQERVKAIYFFSKEYVDLALPGCLGNFYGTLDRYLEYFWCNPPFSEIKQFAENLAYLQKRNLLGSGVVLANSNTETKFFKTLESISSYIVYPNKRLQFYDPSQGKVARNNLKGQALFVINRPNTIPYLTGVANTIKDYGTIQRPIHFNYHVADS